MGSSQKVFAVLFSLLLIQSGTNAMGLKHRRQQGLAQLLLGGLLTLLFSEQIGKHQEHKIDMKDILRSCGQGHFQDHNALSSMLMSTHVPPMGAARTPNPFSPVQHGLGMLPLPPLPSLLGGIGARIGGLAQGRNARGYGRRLDLNPFTMGYGFGNALGLTGLHGIGNIIPPFGVQNALKSNLMNPLLPNMFTQGLTRGLPQGLGHGLPLGLGHGLSLGLGHGLPLGMGSGLQSGLGLFPGISPFLLPSLDQGLMPNLPEGFSPGFPPELSHVLLQNLAKNQDAGHQQQSQQRTPENEGPSTDFDMSEIPFPENDEEEKKNVNDRRPDVSGSGDSSVYNELQ